MSVKEAYERIRAIKDKEYEWSFIPLHEGAYGCAKEVLAILEEECPEVLIMEEDDDE